MGAAHGRWWDHLAQEDLDKLPEWIPKAQVIVEFEGCGRSHNQGEGQGEDHADNPGDAPHNGQGEDHVAKQHVDEGEIVRHAVNEGDRGREHEGNDSIDGSKARAGSQRVWDADAERWWLERAQTRHKTNWRPLPPHVNKVHVDSDDTSDEKMQSIRKKKGKVKTKGKGKIIKGKRKAAKAKKKAEIEDECDDKSRTAEQSQPATKSGACKLSPFEDDVRNDGRWLCREELEFELQFRRTNFNALATSTACSFTAPSASSLPHPWCSDKAAAAADRCALLTSAEPNTVADSPAQRSVHFTSAEEDDVSAGGNSVDGVPTAGQVFAEDAWFALEWLLGAMRVCDSAACGAIGLDGEADVAGSSACDREQYVAKARDVIRAPGFVQQCFDGLSGRGKGGAKEDEQLLELLSQLHEGVATHAGSVGDMLNGQGTIAGTSCTHAFVCDDSVRPAFRTDPQGWGAWTSSHERQFCSRLVNLFQGWLRRHAERDARHVK